MPSFFKRKSPMDRLEAELASLRSRAETLNNRHRAADAAFLDAKTKLQCHHLEADLNVDDKVRARLEAAVATCAVTREGYADALNEVHAQMAEAERKIAAEQDAIKRAAAADQLDKALSAFEVALPKFLEQARILAIPLAEIGWHYESGQLKSFIENVAAQIELAAGVNLTELSTIPNAIRQGRQAIPGERAPVPVAAAIDPTPETQTVFMLRSARYRDHDGRKRFAGQWEDAIMPLATAQRALRERVAAPVTDPRRAKLRGVRGGDFNPNAPDVVDLDAIEEHQDAPLIEPDPVLRAANFTEIDRSDEARSIQVEVPRA